MYCLIRQTTQSEEPSTPPPLPPPTGLVEHPPPANHNQGWLNRYAWVDPESDNHQRTRINISVLSSTIQTSGLINTFQPFSATQLVSATPIINLSHLGTALLPTDLVLLSPCQLVPAIHILSLIILYLISAAQIPGLIIIKLISAALVSSIIIYNHLAVGLSHPEPSLTYYHLATGIWQNLNIKINASGTWISRCFYVLFSVSQVALCPSPKLNN